MTRLSRFFLYFILVVLAVWQLPWCYAFLTVKAAPQRFVMYSSLLGDFLLTGYEEGTGLTRHDTQGHSYTEQEVDSLLPMFYMRQLVADERFPDSLFGQPVSPREVQQTSFNFRMRPSAVNAPASGIYFFDFNKQHFSKSQKDNAVVFTSINSLKVLKRSLKGVDFADYNVVIDTLNRYTVDFKENIYPLIVYLDKGKIVKVDMQSPETDGLSYLQQQLEEKYVDVEE